MPAQLFEATVRQRAGLAVIDLEGDVNRDAEPGLSTAYAAAAAAGAGAILLNFAAVGFINSTGIAVIVGLLARARQDGRALVVCGLTEHYRSIFEITRLIDFMQVYTSEEAAISSASEAAR
jgi:anti-anti-sigma factor